MKNITILAALLGLSCTSETMMIPEDIIGEAGATTEVPETGGTEATGGSGTGGNEPTGGNVETGGTEPTGGNEPTGGTATGGNGTGGTEDPYEIFYKSESNPNGVPNNCEISYWPDEEDCYIGDGSLFFGMSALYCSNEQNYPTTETLDDKGYIYYTIEGYTETIKCKNYNQIFGINNDIWCCSNIDKYLN